MSLCILKLERVTLFALVNITNNKWGTNSNIINLWINACSLLQAPEILNLHSVVWITLLKSQTLKAAPACRVGDFVVISPKWDTLSHSSRLLEIYGEEGAERLEKSVVVDNFMKAAFYRHNIEDAHLSSQGQHEVSPKFNPPARKLVTNGSCRKRDYQFFSVE